MWKTLIELKFKIQHQTSFRPFERRRKFGIFWHSIYYRCRMNDLIHYGHGQCRDHSRCYRCVFVSALFTRKISNNRNFMVTCASVEDKSTNRRPILFFIYSTFHLLFNSRLQHIFISVQFIQHFHEKCIITQSTSFNCLPRNSEQKWCAFITIYQFMPLTDDYRLKTNMI